MLERERLRHDLAHHDVEVAQDREREDHGDRRRDARVPARREQVERPLQEVRDDRLADGAERQAGERDSQLDGRDESGRLFEQA
jgi:hypothetical protein